MKAKMKCAQCATRFEPTRSDAQYCSNACKQKAHTIRKKESNQKQNPELVFYLDEYIRIRKYYEIKAEDMPLIFYCFLRTNLPSDADEKSIINYLDAVWIGNNRDYLLLTNAYVSFEEKFLNNLYKVLINKNQ